MVLSWLHNYFPPSETKMGAVIASEAKQSLKIRNKSDLLAIARNNVPSWFYPTLSLRVSGQEHTPGNFANKQ